MIEESMTSGRSVSPWNSRTARLMSSASSARGAPMFTSSTMAPPATCWATSVSTRDRSPARSSCWNALREVGLVLSDRVNELLRRHLHAQVDHLEPGALEHDVHQVLADVVHVALDRAHDHLADRGGAGLGQQRPQDLQRPGHRLARDQHLRHKEVAALEPGADLTKRRDQRVVEQRARAHAHAEAPL